MERGWRCGGSQAAGALSASRNSPCSRFALSDRVGIGVGLRGRGTRHAQRASAAPIMRSVAGVGRAELDRTRAPAKRQGFASKFLLPFEGAKPGTAPQQGA